MQSINQYIGISYKFLGESKDGIDCLGLLRLYYKDNGWNERFTDGKPIEQHWYKLAPCRFLMYLGKRFDITRDTNDLSIGDIVYLRISGEGHTAIYIGYGQIMTLQYPVNENSKVTIYRRSHWLPVFICGFKRRCNSEDH